MANIITRTFSDGPNQGIRLGVDMLTSSVDTYITRQLSFTSNWSVIRMGILFGIAEYPSASYNRLLGLGIGLSSGSSNYCTADNGFSFPIEPTFLGMCWGPLERSMGLAGTLKFEMLSNISGSWFTGSADTAIGGLTTGSIVAGTARIANALPQFIWSNITDTTVGPKRSIMVFEISSSSPTATSEVLKLYGVTSSVYHRDYTSGDLLSIMTGSVVGSNGIPLGRYVSPAISHNKSVFPLDTAYIEYVGGVPIEIYDWYVVKVI